MTKLEKQQAFAEVTRVVRTIENRYHSPARQQAKLAQDLARAHKAANERYSALEAQREQARKSGGFSLLK